MPTAHPRIAITRDPELDEALRRVEPLFGDSTPTATLARELILRGAGAVLAGSGPDIDRWLSERGAGPATRSIREAVAIAAGLPPVDHANPRALSDAVRALGEDPL